MSQVTYPLRFGFTTLDFPMLKLHDSQLLVVTPASVPTERRLTPQQLPSGAGAPKCRAPVQVPGAADDRPARLPPGTISQPTTISIRENLKNQDENEK